MNQPRILYRHPISGHAHRVELFLSLLGLPFERVDVDLPAGAHKQPAFLKLNPLGQVPVLVDGELTLPDSNAILVYLALRYDADRSFYPSEPEDAGQVQRYLSVAAGPLASGPSALRRVALLGGALDRESAERTTAQLLGALEGELSGKPFLVAGRPTLAELSLYTYVAHAPVGGVSLAPYPAVRAWLARIESLPGFVQLELGTAPAESRA